MLIDEKELIQKSIDGDAMAFEQLVQRYDRRVLSMALKYLNNEDDAKDVYQEVFIRVYKSLKNFKHQSEFSTWLYRITANACFTYQTKTQKRKQVPLEPSENEEENLLYNKADTGTPGPDKVYQNNELSKEIEKALNKLSPKQKMIFTLKHYEGQKIREISDMLNIKEGTIKKYLFEASHKMRVLLSGYCN